MGFANGNPTIGELRACAYLKRSLRNPCECARPFPLECVCLWKILKLQGRKSQLERRCCLTFIFVLGPKNNLDQRWTHSDRRGFWVILRKQSEQTLPLIGLEALLGCVLA